MGNVLWELVVFFNRLCYPVMCLTYIGDYFFFHTHILFQFNYSNIILYYSRKSMKSKIFTILSRMVGRPTINGKFHNNIIISIVIHLHMIILCYLQQNQNVYYFQKNWICFQYLKLLFTHIRHYTVDISCQTKINQYYIAVPSSVCRI